MTIRLIDALLDRRRMIAALAGLLCGALLLAAGGGIGLDRQLRELRDGVRRHAASGEVAIVEIDSRSVRRIDHWPWPRRYHAAAIDRLHRAGARTIGFDVDFSSPSSPADDAALAAALARAGGGVILATLRQQESSENAGSVDNLPIQPLRDHAFLAAVNVIPDEDGQVRQMLLGLETGGVPRPALAAMIAERDASTGAFFPIDYAIDPDTIPRISFIDLVEGRVPAAAIAGKRILIGATAVEIGDRYGAPGRGVLPGVVIQALAAETLLAGPPPTVASGLWALLLALAAIALALRPGRLALRAAAFAWGTAAVLLLPLVGEQYFALSVPLAPALAALSAAAATALTLHLGARWRRRARTDDATGLPNLAALAAYDQQGRATIVVARIDRFAAIAAGLGPAATVNLVHRVADRLAFGRRLAVYRIDEAHLAWREDGEDAAALDQRLEALAALMRSPVDCGRLVDVDLAFGIAGAGERDLRQQVANAALAAERAARRGSRWEWFVAGDDAETDWHLSLLGELDQAMVEGQVWTAYQPKLDIASGRIVGAEALVRWDHPERGPIGPDAFIPLVEAHGRGRDLTLHVLRRALEDAARWRGAGHDMAIAVNVSATLLLDAAFAVLLEREIRAAQIPAECVTLEVTETAAMRDSEAAVAALASWRALGLAISIDDYGTGQSSLAYLQTLPATELKIDKSFISTLAGEPRNAIMVRSTIAMAHELGMKVVAEGIEDAACLALLAEMGCDTGQGWHIARPMPADALAAFLAAPERRAA